uniref:Uncharacterized protein n=1 Tax=Romanomermis culicivorax TaxID=13658 RepID=A0A915JQG9_ROMCU
NSTKEHSGIYECRTENEAGKHRLIKNEESPYSDVIEVVTNMGCLILWFGFVLAQLLATVAMGQIYHVSGKVTGGPENVSILLYYLRGGYPCTTTKPTNFGRMV